MSYACPTSYHTLVRREQEEPIRIWSRCADGHDLPPLIQCPRSLECVATSLVQQGLQILHSLIEVPHEVARLHASPIIGDSSVPNARAPQDCPGGVDRLGAALFIPPKAPSICNCPLDALGASGNQTSASVCCWLSANPASAPLALN
jgi:hypothetical protein